MLGTVSQADRDRKRVRELTQLLLPSTGAVPKLSKANMNTLQLVLKKNRKKTNGWVKTIKEKNVKSI